MIQVNELRIGNTITHQNNNGIYLVTVLETLKNGVNVKTNLQLGEWFLRHEEVQGTPLTEEWLLNFGFGYNMPGTAMWRCDEFLIGVDKEGFHYGIWAYDNEEPYPDLIKKIEYVHQLQNLYFALTRKELACK